VAHEERQHHEVMLCLDLRLCCLREQRLQDQAPEEPRESAAISVARLLSQHLTLARDGALPVRMVVTSSGNGRAGKVSERRKDVQSAR
jgi:hypothetical protein